MAHEALQVIAEPKLPDGTPVEPEERQARHVLEDRAPLIGSLTGAEVGTLPAEIAVQSTAGELANLAAHKCHTCEFFDVARWRGLRHDLEQSPKHEDRVFLESIRQNTEAFLTPVDLDAELDRFGLCNAMTEIFSSFAQQLSPQIVHPLSGCPSSFGPRGEILSGLYKPRDRANARVSGHAFDSMIQLALHPRTRR